MSRTDCTRAAQAAQQDRVERRPSRRVTSMSRLPLVAVFALSAGCSPSPPPPPAAAPPASILSLKQVMEWVIDPAADAIWDSVKTIMTEAGTKEVRPETNEQWEAVRNGAATLTEAANMLTVDGRAKDRKDWMAAASALVTNAEKSLKAAEAKDVDALFAAGGDVYTACRNCHVQYANHLVDSGAPAERPLVTARLDAKARTSR